MVIPGREICTFEFAGIPEVDSIMIVAGVVIEGAPIFILQFHVPILTVQSTGYPLAIPFPRSTGNILFPDISTVGNSTIIWVFIVMAEEFTG